MPNVESLTVTLRPDLAKIVRAKVLSGEYASEIEFLEAAIVDSIPPPIVDTDLEHWIAGEGVRRYDAMKADPSRGLTSEEVFASLGIEPEELRKAG